MDALDILKLFEENNLGPSFCMVPFEGLILQADGTISCCRNLGSEHTVGTIESGTLLEIWNSPALQSLRQEFLSKNIVTCKEHIRHRGCNLWPEYNTRIELLDPSPIQSRPPKRLALNLNGHCNLHCGMCDIRLMPNGRYDNEPFWNNFTELLPHLDEIEFFSGEPFIQKDTFKVFELARKINPTCRFNITTNGQWKLTPALRELLDTIHLSTLIISLDSLDPDTYARIRKGGQLSVVLENLSRILDYQASRPARGLTAMKVWANFLIQKDNWTELPHFHRFCEDRGIFISNTYLKIPENYSLSSLSEDEKVHVFHTLTKTLSPADLNYSKRILVALLDSITPVTRAALLLQLKESSTETPRSG